MASLPCFVIWLVLMTLIWLFLLGWAKVISGHFTPIEVIFDLGRRCRWHRRLGDRFSMANYLELGQSPFRVPHLHGAPVVALRISFLPSIAEDQ